MIAPTPVERPTLGQSATELLRLSFPLIVSQLFFTLQILIDRTMLSWYNGDASAAALAAAMLAFIPISFMQNTAGFATTFVAQYVGAGRPQRVGPVVNQALYFSLFTGVAFMGLYPFANEVVAWTGHSAALQPLETIYLGCFCFVALPVMVSASVTAFFAGRGDTWTVIWINAVGTVVNAVLDYALIFGNWGFPEWGIAGAGWATVAGCAASAVAALALYGQHKYRAAYATVSGWRFDAALMRQLLRFGGPNGLQCTFDVLAWTLFVVMVGWLGDTEIAATNLVFIVNASFLIPMLGLGQGVSVFVGQHLGGDRPEFAERFAWLGFALAATVMTAAGVIVALMPGVFLTLFASDANPAKWAATAALVPTLLIFVAVYTFFDSMNIIFAFALRGAGDTRFVTLVTIVIGLTTLVVPTYLVCQHGWGLYWAWTCATAYIAVLALTFLARFRWGPWRSMRVIEPVAVEAV